MKEEVDVSASSDRSDSVREWVDVWHGSTLEVKLQHEQNLYSAETIERERTTSYGISQVRVQFQVLTY